MNKAIIFIVLVLANPLAIGSALLVATPTHVMKGLYQQDNIIYTRIALDRTAGEDIGCKSAIVVIPKTSLEKGGDKFANYEAQYMLLAAAVDSNLKVSLQLKGCTQPISARNPTYPIVRKVMLNEH